MENITHHAADNMGGVPTFSWVPIEDVVGIPHRTGTTIATAITLDSSADWYTAEIAQDSGHFQEPEEGPATGPIYKPVFTCFVANINPTIEANLEEMARHRHIVKCPDSNGHTRLMGTIANPLIMTYKKDTGQGAVGRNGYNISFQHKYGQGYPAPFYTA